MSRVKRIAVVLAMVGAFGLASSACFVAVDEPAGPVVSYGGYTPLYYNGAIVYYDAAGVPFYYHGGRTVYVPVGYRTRYVSYYRRHRVRYNSWYRHRGRHARYRTYNRRRYRRNRSRRRVKRNTKRRTRRKTRTKRRRGRF